METREIREKINDLGRKGLDYAAEAAFQDRHSLALGPDEMPPHFGSSSDHARGQAQRLAAQTMDYVAEHGLPTSPAQVRALSETVGPQTRAHSELLNENVPETDRELRSGSMASLEGVCELLDGQEGPAIFPETDTCVEAIDIQRKLDDQRFGPREAGILPDIEQEAGQPPSVRDLLSGVQPGSPSAVAQSLSAMVTDRGAEGLAQGNAGPAEPGVDADYGK